MNETTGRKSFRIRLHTMIDHIRNGIEDGTYAKDSYLPSESALAKQFQLSNNTVRKGLEQLVNEGWIVKVDKVGSRVTGTTYHKQTTLSVVGYPMNNRDIDFTYLIERFQTLYPSIRVIWNKEVAPNTFSPGKYTEYISESIEKGTVDVFLLHHVHFREFVESGHTSLLEPISPNKDMYSFLNDAFTAEGRTYAQPIIFSPVMLGYNRDHFRQADVAEPDSGWTWDDLIRAAIQLTIPNERNGFYFYQTGENRWPLLLLQSGMPFAAKGTAEGECDYRGTRLMDGIRLYGEIIRNGSFFPHYMSETPHDASRLFLEGKISMTLLTYTSLNDLKHSDIDYDISAVPFMHTPITLLTMMGMIVNKNSKNKEAAQLFADYIASRETQETIRRRTLSLPAMKQVAEMPVKDHFNRPLHDSLFREIIPSYRTHSAMNMPVRSYDTLLHLLKLFWAGLIDEPTLCERLKQI